jgi:pyruvate/2-oxoglutarate dehydrogenase complex dihydrolipoamide dehydrogenase (E3) component
MKTYIKNNIDFAHNFINKNITEISFEKLVLATGSIPVVPKWLKGTDLNNVFIIHKNKVYLAEMLIKLKDCKKIVTVGGGFIGVEMSDELNKKNKDVTLVEILPNILGLAFDKELAVEAEQILQDRGVKIKTGIGVKEIVGDKKVSSVLLNNSEKIQADAVILSMGYDMDVYGDNIPIFTSSNSLPASNTLVKLVIETPTPLFSLILIAKYHIPSSP